MHLHFKKFLILKKSTSTIYLDRLERIEKNISDIQKGKFDSLDKSLSSGYISRNENEN